MVTIQSWDKPKYLGFPRKSFNDINGETCVKSRVKLADLKSEYYPEAAITEGILWDLWRYRKVELTADVLLRGISCFCDWPGCGKGIIIWRPRTMFVMRKNNLVAIQQGHVYTFLKDWSWFKFFQLYYLYVSMKTKWKVLFTQLNFTSLTSVIGEHTPKTTCVCEDVQSAYYNRYVNKRYVDPIDADREGRRGTLQSWNSIATWIFLFYCTTGEGIFLFFLSWRPVK